MKLSNFIQSRAMFSIENQAGTTWEIVWDPNFGSPQSRYSFGDTGWRFPALLLAEAVSRFSQLVKDIGITVSFTADKIDFATLSTFGEWEPFAGTLQTETSYYRSDPSGESFLYPWHREAIDDAAFYVTRLAVPAWYSVFAGRSMFSLNAPGESQPSELLVVDSSAMGDRFSVTGCIGTLGALHTSDLIAKVVEDINRSVV
jgi:hypothetical protein